MLAPAAPPLGPPPPAPADAPRPGLRLPGTPRAALLAAGAAGCLAVGLVDPSTAPLPGCPWRALTGVDCPGCGSTRALHALLRGDLGTAIDHNLLLVATVALVAVSALVAAGRRATGRPPLPDGALGSGARLVASLAVAATVAAFWILRTAGPDSMRWLASGA